MEQSSNALESISLTLLPITISVKFEQLEKASAPILVTSLGIIYVVSFLLIGYLIKAVLLLLNKIPLSEA